MKHSLLLPLMLAIGILPMRMVAQPDYTVRMLFDSTVGNDTYEWSIYLQKTNPRWNDYAGGQYIFTFNTGILGGGTATFTVVSSTSDFALTNQNPVNASVSQAELRVQARTPPGTGNGFVVSTTAPGNKVCRVRVKGSGAFTPGQRPDIAWKSTGAGFLTVVNGYVNGVNTVLTGTFDAQGMTNPVLPVELTSFSAEVDGEGVMLRWHTAAEQNNCGFEVQRSTHPADAAWETIGFVQGGGTTTEGRDYQHRDAPQPAGAWYRLLQKDCDGTVSTSRVVHATGTRPSGLLLHPMAPNPVAGASAVSFTLPDSRPVVVTVFDMLGQRRLRVDCGVLAAGYHSRLLALDKLPAGQYQCLVEAGDDVKAGRFSVIH